MNVAGSGKISVRLSKFERSMRHNPRPVKKSIRRFRDIC
jgi:hypothetical protein